MKRLLSSRFIAFALALLFLGPTAAADGISPVTMQVTETEPGRLLVQWRVPRQLPPQAIPSPRLPDTCTTIGERELVERPGAWILRQAYRCPDGLSGRVLAIEYPFLNATVSTLMRVELLSGARYSHILAPGEASWRVPESAADGPPVWIREARGAALTGARHFGRNPVHLLFLLSLLLLGTPRTAIRLATLFTAGQLVAVMLGQFTGLELGLGFAEIGVAVAAALLAREALRPAAERRQLVALAAAAGLVHGLSVRGLGLGETTGLLADTLSVLGLDAVLVLGVFAGSLLVRAVPPRLCLAPCPSIAAYLVASVALGLAFAAPIPATSAARAARSDPSGLALSGLRVPGAAASVPASKRLAAQFPDAALQSFVTIGAFEVRLEVLVRLRELSSRFGLEPSGVLEVEAQAALEAGIADLVATQSRMTIDGALVDPSDRRVEFLTLDARGALPRPSAVPESIEAAWVGVTAVYLTGTTPRDVTLDWRRFDVVAAIQATVTDPEFTRSAELTADRPTLRWVNELADDPVPQVSATSVEPETLWVPTRSLLPLAAALALVLVAVRRKHRGLSRAVPLALARVLGVSALLLAPLGGVAWALPFSTGSVPDTSQARRILAGVLPNLYRSFEFPTESAAYDRLSLTVTGETLADVYLEHRTAVEREERGGARARVEAVEVLQVNSVKPAEGAGFVAEARWSVGGTVTHFGHRHFRQNAYDARILIVPVAGSWKIQSIDVHDEQRLR